MWWVDRIHWLPFLTLSAVKIDCQGAANVVVQAGIHPPGSAGLGLAGRVGLRERDFTAFIKPGGFLGRNQTKKLTKKIIKKDHKDELECPHNQALSTQHPV